jgi:hypothetical protein
LVVNSGVHESNASQRDLALSGPWLKWPTLSSPNPTIYAQRRSETPQGRSRWPRGGSISTTGTTFQVPRASQHAPLLACACRIISHIKALLMGGHQQPNTTSTSTHPSRRITTRPPPIYSRDFAYPNNGPQLVLPGPRMAGKNIRDASASSFAEYVLFLFVSTHPRPSSSSLRL